jgi:predicted transposase YbfD/YdcC
VLFPPQAQSTDKGHGRLEQRQLWSQVVDGATLGLAGAAQIFRIDQQVDYLRRGKVVKTTRDTRYGVSSLYAEEADAPTLLGLVRGYWGIETRQHYRRDHTQREDHCQVRQPTTARNLSLMRSLAIFLHERQRESPTGKGSLPDWQRRNLRQPNPLIARFTAGTD